jgi:hypothetical protein
MRVILTTLLLCAAIGAARAETVEVTGVAFDDVLNLRTEPRSSAPLAGALPPTAFGIEALKRADGCGHNSCRASGRPHRFNAWARSRSGRSRLTAIR